MRIEQFSDKHGIYVRASEEAFLVTKEEAASIREYIDNLRELVRFANKTVEGLCGIVENSPGCSMCPLNQDEDKGCGAAELFSRMKELGVEA